MASKIPGCLEPVRLNHMQQSLGIPMPANLTIAGTAVMKPQCPVGFHGLLCVAVSNETKLRFDDHEGGVSYLITSFRFRCRLREVRIPFCVFGSGR